MNCDEIVSMQITSEYIRSCVVLPLMWQGCRRKLGKVSTLKWINLKP